MWPAWEREREGEREGGREREREGEREGGRERGRERERECITHADHNVRCLLQLAVYIGMDSEATLK